VNGYLVKANTQRGEGGGCGGKGALHPPPLSVEGHLLDPGRECLLLGLTLTRGAADLAQGGEGGSKGAFHPSPQ